MDELCINYFLEKKNIVKMHFIYDWISFKRVRKVDVLLYAPGS